MKLFIMDVTSSQLIECIRVSSAIHKMGYERTGWKKRYAILDGRNFVYFKSASDMEKGKKPRGEGRLIPTTTARQVQGGKHICTPDSYAKGAKELELNPDKPPRKKILDDVALCVEFGPISVRQKSSSGSISMRTYYISFDTELDMHRWLDAVAQNVTIVYSGARKVSERLLSEDSVHGSDSSRRMRLPHSTRDMTRRSLQSHLSAVTVEDKEEEEKEKQHMNQTTQSQAHDWMRVSIIASRGTVSEMIAVIEGGIDVIELGNDPDVEAIPLVQAAAYGNLPMINFLLENGAAINKLTSLGNTALHLAAKHGQTTACRLLLSHNADQDIRNASGQLPADLCVYKETLRLFLKTEIELEGVKWPQPISANDTLGESDILKQLKQRAIESSSGTLEDIVTLHRARYPMDAEQPQSGSTPLMIAAGVGNVRVLRYLLELARGEDDGAGVNIGHKSRKGNTALHLAARRGQAECLKLLLAAGANVSEVNNAGETAYDVAASVCRDILLPPSQTSASASGLHYTPYTQNPGAGNSDPAYDYSLASADLLLAPSLDQSGPLRSFTAEIDQESYDQ